MMPRKLLLLLLTIGAVSIPPASGTPLETKPETLSPAERSARVENAAKKIAERDAWQKVHGSPARAAIEAIPALRVTPPAPPRLPQTPRPGLSAEQQRDAAELEALDREFADAIHEMHARALTPVERIRVVDEFWRVNQPAVADQRALREKLAPARRSATGVVPVPKIPANPEESRKAETLRAFQARRETLNQLPPAERIAAMDREGLSIRALAELLPAPIQK